MASVKQVNLIARLVPELSDKLDGLQDEAVKAAAEAKIASVQDHLVTVLADTTEDHVVAQEKLAGRDAHVTIDTLFAVGNLLDKALSAGKFPGIPSTATRIITNRFAKRCSVCKTNVEAEAGHAAQVNGAWLTFCATCATTDPAVALAEAKAKEAAEVAAAEAKREQMRRVRALIFQLKDRVQDTRDHAVRFVVPGTVLDVDNSEAAYKVCWGAKVFVVRQTGAPGSVRSVNLGLDSIEKLLTHVLGMTNAELVEAQSLYGQHFHECGRCGSPLSDDDSKARGLGPDCARKGL